MFQNSESNEFEIIIKNIKNIKQNGKKLNRQNMGKLFLKSF